MPLSANTLIHFTHDKEALKKILIESFRVFYCKESIVLDGNPTVFHVPMVSFCDIPLSEVKDHIAKYGHYGIGLTKAWGNKMGLNPVLYVASGSTLSASYRLAYNHFARGRGGPGDGDPDNWTREQKAVVDVLRYIKNYEGNLVRKGGTIANYRFSDEREWRHVPSYEVECDMVVGGDYYAVPENKAAVDAAVVDLRLEFTANDIKYIIIDNDHEIREFVQHLRSVKGPQYSYDDVDRLTTRLLTREQILGDI